MLRCQTPHCGGQLLPVALLASDPAWTPNAPRLVECLLCSREYRYYPRTQQAFPVVPASDSAAIESDAEAAATQRTVARFRAQMAVLRPPLLPLSLS